MSVVLIYFQIRFRDGDDENMENMKRQLETVISTGEV